MHGSQDLHGSQNHGARKFRRGRRRAAVAAALVVPALILASGTATAKPGIDPPPSDGSLTPGTLIDLRPGARNIQVDESSGGGSVAVSWSVRNASGRDEVWARVKRGNSWGSKVRVSDPGASATRHTMDLDSDGSLLVAWAEQRGSVRTLVTRRLSRSSLGARTVLPVAATDGPYVAAGPLHDVVAWTAPSSGRVRPFASVDTGAGFPAGVAVSSSGWKHPVINGTLAVNADGREVHITYLSEDSAANRTRASWSVLETTRTTAWAFWDGLGSNQKSPDDPKDGAPLRPLIAVDDRGIAALAFYNISEHDAIRYPRYYVYKPNLSGSARSRLSDPKSLDVLAEVDPTAEPAPPPEFRRLASLGNRRGVLIATYSTDGGQKARLKQLTDPDDPEFLIRDWSADALCSPRTEWFFTWQERDAEIHCLDDESSPGAIEIWLNAFSPAVSTVSPDSTLAGSTLTGTVPDPLISAIVITENLSGTANDPVWLLDHTEGGSDAAPPLLELSRTKAPKISGTPRVGKKLTAKIGVWKPGPSKVTYRWFAGKKAIKGQTKSRLTLTKKMTGKKISVRLQLSRSGYASKSITVKRGPKIQPKKRR